MSTITTKKRQPAKTVKRRKKAKTYTQLNSQAERELDRAFKKVMKAVHGNHYQELKELEHIQTLLEKETGGKAFILSPDLPIPKPIVDRVLSEQVRVPSASEALYAFVGWLTTRELPVIMSAKHNSAVVSKLVNIFLIQQGLPIPCPNWEDQFISLAAVATDLTNDPALNPNKLAPPPPTFEEAYEGMLITLRRFNPQRQNHLLGSLLQEIKQELDAHIQIVSEAIEDRQQQKLEFMNTRLELLKICAGDFSIVHP